MAFKLAVFSCLFAAAYGSVAPAAVAYSAPVVAAAPVAARLEEFDAYPQYRFGYDVADSLTGDYKSQSEQRDGDVVQGQYSLVEADGTRRIVDYAADPVNGFNAVVRNEPLVAAAPAVVAEPAVVSARLAAAPVAQPVVARYAVAAPARVVAAAPAPARYVAAAPAPARYVAAAPAPARYVAAAPAPAVAEQFVARYAAAPFANYPVAARLSAYRAPVAYSAAYTGPVAAAYSAPVAAAYPAPVAAAYSAQVAQYSGPVSYASYAPGYAVAQPARLVAPAAPAKIVEPVAAAGYRYP